MNTTLRRLFWIFNKYFMVPVFRLGLGPLMVNPLTGYILVLKTVGRKTGKIRYAPVNYAILNGSIYCLAGFGQVSDWYRNLKAHPQVELILPGRALSGAVCEVTDPKEYRTAARRVLIAGGFAGFFNGFNPFTVSDDVLETKLKGIPVLRIQPIGLANGPSDSGGWAWIPLFLLFAALIVFFIR